MQGRPDLSGLHPELLRLLAIRISEQHRLARQSALPQSYRTSLFAPLPPAHGLNRLGMPVPRGGFGGGGLGWPYDSRLPSATAYPSKPIEDCVSCHGRVRPPRVPFPWPSPPIARDTPVPPSDAPRDDRNSASSSLRPTLMFATDSPTRRRAPFVAGLQWIDTLTADGPVKSATPASSLIHLDREDDGHR